MSNKHVVSPKDKDFVIKSYEDDYLKTKDKVDAFANALRNDSTNSKYAVIAPWGGGKSFFVNQVKYVLEKDNKNLVVMFDALEHNFYDDPILSLIMVILDAVEFEDESIEKEIAKTVVKIAKATGVSILKNVGKGFVRKAIGVDLDSINTEDQEVEADQLLSLFKEKMNISNDLHKILDNIKKSKRVVRIVQDDGKEKVIKTTTDNIYIVIDDLDRCSPHFAIKTIETIASVLSETNIKFIYSVAFEELCNSIKGYYGSEFNSKEYLEKYIDNKYCLNISMNEVFNYVGKFLDSSYINSQSGYFTTIVLNKYEVSVRTALRVTSFYGDITMKLLYYSASPNIKKHYNITDNFKKFYEMLVIPTIAIAKVIDPILLYQKSNDFDNFKEYIKNTTMKTVGDIYKRNLNGIDDPFDTMTYPNEEDHFTLIRDTFRICLGVDIKMDISMDL